MPQLFASVLFGLFLSFSASTLFGQTDFRQASFGQTDWGPSPRSLESMVAETAWSSASWPTQNLPPSQNLPQRGPLSLTSGYTCLDCDTAPTFSSYDASTGLSTESCDYASESCRPRGLWYASAAGLVMGRNKANRVWTTYENNNNANQLMHTQDVDPNWRGGYELHLGRSVACGAWALDLGYWELDDFQASASQTHANSVSSPLQFNDLEFGVGVPVVDYFDSAQEHRLTRRNRIRNIELNLIEGVRPEHAASRWTFRKMFGVRYFAFDEDLTFASLDLGGVWGGNGGADEAYLEDSTKNDLIGAQIGCQVDRRWRSGVSLFATPKIGIYNNRIENRFQLRRGDGVIAAPSSFSGVAGSYPVESSTNVVSFLSEMNLGVAWRPSAHWSMFGGYRVVVLTGVGLADDQIPQFIVDIPEIAAIESNATLVLQGVFAGISYAR